MKKQISIIAIAAFVSFTFINCKEKAKDSEMETMDAAEATAGSAEYNVDTAASEVIWAGKKPLGAHNGTVKISEGSFYTNNGAVEAGKFVLDMSSIISLDLDGEQKENLESHLKGTVEGKEGDFFNVKQYPQAIFEMTGTAEKDGKNYVMGNLTIKDKTNPIEFPATLTIAENMITLQSESFMIDRTKWDVNYGSKSVFDNLGDKFINDEMEITVKVVAKK